MCFIGQDKENTVFLLCFAVSRDLNQGLTHKKKTSSVQTTPADEQLKHLKNASQHPRATGQGLPVLVFNLF